MLTTRGNIHRNPMPALGAVVIVRQRGMDGPLSKGAKRALFRRYRVEAFNLCDSADYRYSLGSHLVHLRALDNGAVHTVAGFRCEEVDATRGKYAERSPVGSRAVIFAEPEKHRHTFNGYSIVGRELTSASRTHRCDTCGELFHVTPQRYRAPKVSLKLTKKERAALALRPLTYSAVTDPAVAYA